MYVCRAVYGVTIIKIIKELYVHCKNVEFIVQREREIIKKMKTTMKTDVRIYLIDSGPKECGHTTSLLGQIQHLSVVKEKTVPCP